LRKRKKSRPNGERGHEDKSRGKSNEAHLTNTRRTKRYNKMDIKIKILNVANGHKTSKSENTNEE
jgi:hypothetical protein